MSKYLVERYLPKFTQDQLVAAATRAKITTAEMSKEGTPIRYLRSFFMPGEDKCFCLFEGENADSVLEANRRAELPVQKISEALSITTEEIA